jgi:hypothetical protein
VDLYFADHAQAAAVADQMRVQALVDRAGGVGRLQVVLGLSRGLILTWIRDGRIPLVWEPLLAHLIRSPANGVNALAVQPPQPFRPVAIHEALAVTRSCRALARLVGVSVSTVGAWKKAGGAIPGRYQTRVALALSAYQHAQREAVSAAPPLRIRGGFRVPAAIAQFETDLMRRLLEEVKGLRREVDWLRQAVEGRDGR